MCTGPVICMGYVFFLCLDGTSVLFTWLHAFCLCTCMNTRPASVYMCMPHLCTCMYTASVQCTCVYATSVHMYVYQLPSHLCTCIFTFVHICIHLFCVHGSILHLFLCIYLYATSCFVLLYLHVNHLCTCIYSSMYTKCTSVYMYVYHMICSVCIHVCCIYSLCIICSVYMSVYPICSVCIHVCCIYSLCIICSVYMSVYPVCSMCIHVCCICSVCCIGLYHLFCVHVCSLHLFSVCSRGHWQPPDPGGPATPEPGWSTRGEGAGGDWHRGQQEHVSWGQVCAQTQWSAARDSGPHLAWLQGSRHREGGRVVPWRSVMALSGLR